MAEIARGRHQEPSTPRGSGPARGAGPTPPARTPIASDTIGWSRWRATSRTARIMPTLSTAGPIALAKKRPLRVEDAGGHCGEADQDQKREHDSREGAPPARACAGSSMKPGAIACRDVGAKTMPSTVVTVRASSDRPRTGAEHPAELGPVVARHVVREDRDHRGGQGAFGEEPPQDVGDAEGDEERVGERARRRRPSPPPCPARTPEAGSAGSRWRSRRAPGRPALRSPSP